MKLINFFAGPSTSKSTTASLLFALMKIKGINCELIQEAAKDHVWAEDFKALECQPYITGKQLYRQWKLLGQVDYAVTDSPILLGLHYKGFGCSDDWERSVIKQFNLFDNFNVFLERDNDVHPFQQKGRIQNLEESIQIDQNILATLDKFEIPYVKVKVQEGTKTAETVLELLGLNKPKYLRGDMVWEEAG